MKKKITAMLLSVVMAVSLTACGSGSGVGKEKDTNISSELTYDHSMELTYAEEFSVDYYNDGYALATVADDGRYLIVPEGKEAPDDLAKDIIVLKQPLTNIYLVASAVMDMFVSIDALDSIRFSSQKEDGWYIEAAKQEMEAGNIIYAGKYSAPDYEQILSEGCGLAIENTMIYHTPEVKEQLEKFNIPVMVDYSSYEKNPLGRTEWVKLYGLLTGHEEEAEQAFEAEAGAFEAVSQEEPTGKTVAFFYITSTGEANVRKSSDYLPKMIELAGGTYIFKDLGDEDDAVIHSGVVLTDAVAVKNGVVAGNGLRCGQLQAIFPRGFVVLLGLIDLFAVFCLADERCRASIALHFGKLLLDFLKLRQVFLPTARTDGKKQNEGNKK